MAAIKIGKWEIDEEELDRDHLAAVERGDARIQREAQAKHVSFDGTRQSLVIELSNGVEFSIPCYLIQGLTNASPNEISDVRIGPRGASLHWEKLNVDLRVDGLLLGIFGTQSWMSALGRQGGQVSSTAKQNAARENGKKGGRPKRTPIQAQAL